MTTTWILLAKMWPALQTLHRKTTLRNGQKPMPTPLRAFTILFEKCAAERLRIRL
jgi:hypothetical protein